MLDTATLASCTGASVARATLFVDSLNEAMQAYEINSTARQAAFLSEIGYESGYLVYTTELWGPTPVQQGYEGRADLGNTQPGDGPLFRGRGLIMITGRANYTAAAEALCLDCVNQPTLLAMPEWASVSAAWWWSTHGLNTLADAGNYEAITRTINGGLTGYEGRCTLWAQAKQALGVGT